MSAKQGNTGAISARGGTVYLVGAGPGDPGLLTVRAYELTASADVILYDRLVDPGVMKDVHADAMEAVRAGTPGEACAGATDEAYAGTECIFVGKQPGQKTIDQQRINELMIRHARAGKSVVRLKGGDPFVFGRGGEEAEVLSGAGIPFEVVPGVTAGVAVPAYAGIPVTHRGRATAVAFAAGHEDPTKEEGESSLDWDALARFPGTLVLYMAARNLAQLAKRLLAGGRDPGEPVTMIERGTTTRQRTTVATLSDLRDEQVTESIEPPAITVIGKVGELRERLAWFESKPLFGLSVTVTRARPQASELADRLRGLGAMVVETPSIRIVPNLESSEVRRAISKIDCFRLICLTSTNGVDLFFRALREAGHDARALGKAQVAAIGPGTGQQLRAWGIVPDILPATFSAEGLVDALDGERLHGIPVLLARARGSREVLPSFLRDRGAEVHDVALYESVTEELTDEAVSAAIATDYITFTSASTARSFFNALGSSHKLPGTLRVVSIGPATSAAIRDRGIEVDVEATRHDLTGLIDALSKDAGSRSGSS